MIVTKPYMERRALATFEAQWPDQHASMMVVSQGGSLGQYCNKEQPFDVVVNIMVGDMQRIIEYPKHGLQSFQMVPETVLRSYENLIKSGYTEHLLKYN